MANKEATVYIVDVGESMAECHSGRTMSDLDWMMHYVWDKITATVAAGRKTDSIGVIGLKTNGSSNSLWDKDQEDSYAHLSVFKNLDQMLFPDIRKLRDLIQPSNTDSGDAISAIVLAMEMIGIYCRRLKYKRRIVLVTNAKTPMDRDGIDQIANKIKDEGIELVILGIDFNDEEYGFKEENKDSLKAENESLLKMLAESCDGLYATLAQAVDEMVAPRIKTVRGVASFKGDLKLGDSSQFPTGLTVQVERYFKTSVARAPTASAFVLSTPSEGQHDADNGESSKAADTNASLTSVRNSRSYYINDEKAPGGKREIERDDLSKGYEYGREAVHIEASDENITRLETTAALDLIGFISSFDYQRYMNMSNSYIIVAQRANEKASLALSSIIHGLAECESFAVGRLVTKDLKPPLVVLLAPFIDLGFECLLEIQLPFAEDVRSYRFPPLDRIVTVSGKVLKEHRNLPSENLLESMGKYVESLDLSELDESSDPLESMAMDQCFSPLLHRIDQAIRWRAVHPTDPIPPIPPILAKLSQMPSHLQQQSKAVLKDLIKAADVKKVPPKAKGRKRNRDLDKPLSGLNVDELLRGEKRLKISPENPIPEFKQSLANTEDVAAIGDAVKQLSTIIENQIQKSFGDLHYNQAVEAIGTMREELIAYEEPNMYNDFIRELKRKLLADKLGGDRKEMWWLIRRNKLGLIARNSSDLSDITEAEAQEFLSPKSSTV